MDEDNFNIGEQIYFSRSQTKKPTLLTIRTKYHDKVIACDSDGTAYEILTEELGANADRNEKDVVKYLKSNTKK